MCMCVCVCVCVCVCSVCVCVCSVCAYSVCVCVCVCLCSTVSTHICTIPEPTSRPEDVSTLPLTHHDLQVCWGPPAFAGQNGRITNYLIKCSGCGQDTYTISSEHKCTVITGLTPFSTVSVSVSAENVAGSGPYSTPVSAVMKVDSESDSINGTREQYVHTPPRVHPHTSSCTCTHLLMYIHTPPHVHPHTFSCTSTHLLMYIHTPPHVHPHTSSCTCTPLHMCPVSRNVRCACHRVSIFMFFNDFTPEICLCG